MRTREPHLLNAVCGNQPRFRLLRLAPLIPNERVKGRALIVERERVARALDLVTELEPTKAQRPDKAVDGILQFTDRQAVGIDGVPKAEKANRFNGDVFLFGVGAETEQHFVT